MDLLEKDQRYVWHPYTSIPHSSPMAIFDSAQGAYVQDVRGRRYLDLTASWWCQTHGHCHPRLVEALRRQAGELDQMLFAPHTHPVAIELSCRLITSLGPPFQRVFFSDDGSTAVETALKMAVQFWRNTGEPRRTRFVSLDGAYHGDTLGAVCVSHVPEFHRFFQALRVPGIRVPVPRPAYWPEPSSPERCLSQCLEAAERRIAERAGEIAAIILEPLLLGAAGMVIYPERYLEGLVAICRRFGILVIFDEVFTGFGRTGPLFAMQRAGCRPDIVCLSKGLTAGMLPLAVTVTTEAVFDAFRGGGEKTFYHGHTFTANPLGCAVALENLKLLEDERTLERNEPKIALLEGWRDRFAGLDFVHDARSIGMVWAIDLVKRGKDGASREPFSPANGPGWRIAHRLWEKGFWIRPLGSTLYVVPPYCVLESELHEFFSVLYSELKSGQCFKE